MSADELQYPFYGVMDNERLAAAEGYHIYGADYVELGNIGTDPAFRRQGLGKMVCAALTRAGAAASPNVYLNVFEQNEAAIRLYRSIGYETVAIQHIIQFFMPADSHK
ncbi:GNAT family N-acetyltransferase [Paenibacillus sp. JTLBN-2024]